jgi:hypothetical protein
VSSIKKGKLQQEEDNFFWHQSSLRRRLKHRTMILRENENTKKKDKNNKKRKCWKARKFTSILCDIKMAVSESVEIFFLYIFLYF